VARPLCPSAPGEAGASLIGIVGPDGRVARLATPLVVDDAFLDTARAGSNLGERFRFSAPCAEAGCGHWTGAACGLIADVRRRASATGLAGEPGLPRCAIRADCRWWQQDAAAACAVCSLVVYGSSLAASGKV